MTIISGQHHYHHNLCHHGPPHHVESYHDQITIEMKKTITMTTTGKEMPAQLSAEQKNVQHAMVAMVENHLHWYDQ